MDLLLCTLVQRLTVIGTYIFMTAVHVSLEPGESRVLSVSKDTVPVLTMQRSGECGHMFSFFGRLLLSHKAVAVMVFFSCVLLRIGSGSAKAVVVQRSGGCVEVRDVRSLDLNQKPQSSHSSCGLVRGQGTGIVSVHAGKERTTTPRQASYAHLHLFSSGTTLF